MLKLLKSAYPRKSSSRFYLLLSLALLVLLSILFYSLMQEFGILAASLIFLSIPFIALLVLGAAAWVENGED